MNNSDENDHLVSGFLMQNGKLIYKDFFSHHFPLPYYWTYLFTPFWSELPSRAIAVFRISVMFLYIGVFSIVFANYKNSISKVALSLWIITISTFLSLYHGNLVLSETFSTIFIAGMFWSVIPTILGWEKRSKFNVFLMLVFASFAFWTQPLTIFLFIIPFLFSKKKQWSKIFFAILVLNLIPPIVFLLTGQLSHFWEQAIWFNFTVYQNNIPELVEKSLSIFQVINLFINNQISLMKNFSNGHELFQLIINYSFLFTFVYFFRKKDIKALFFITVMFIVTRIREFKIITGSPFNFGIFPYLIIGSACFVILVILLRRKILIAISVYVFLIAISVNNSTEIFKQSINPEYNYHVFWSHKQELGKKIESLTNEKENVLIYPQDIELYFFANRLPPDRFTFWYPWIDSVDKYRNERINALDNNPPAVIYVGNLDFKDVKNYYERSFPDLTEDYTNITDKEMKQGIWLRNDLLDRKKNI